jgi:hypothetical protein
MLVRLSPAECCRPFWDTRLDTLDCVLSASMMFHCIASVYYADNSFDGAPADRLELSLIVANLGVVAISVGLYVESLLEGKFKTAAVTGLAKSIADLIVSLQLEMRRDAQSLLHALELAKTAIPPLTKDCRVSHPTNGLGAILAVVPDSSKPYHVLFDSGECHFYSVESAATQLQAYKDRGDAPEAAVLLDEFQQAAQHCLQSDLVSTVALEALFLTLKFLDTDENAKAHTTQSWVSMGLVSFPSLLPEAHSHSDFAWPSDLQVREFLGRQRSEKTKSLERSKLGSLRARLSSLRSLRDLGSIVRSVSPPSEMASFWDSSLVARITLKLCIEIQNSVEPAALRRWMQRNRGNESRVAAFFCFCCWLAPHIPDDAEIGAYSRTLRAKVYRTAARMLPQMIFVAAFGDAVGVQIMHEFMRLWEHAERTHSQDEFRLLENLDQRDHGPFLFWLLNERVQLRCATLASHCH